MQNKVGPMMKHKKQSKRQKRKKAGDYSGGEMWEEKTYLRNV